MPFLIYILLTVKLQILHSTIFTICKREAACLTLSVPYGTFDLMAFQPINIFAILLLWAPIKTLLNLLNLKFSQTKAKTPPDLGGATKCKPEYALFADGQCAALFKWKNQLVPRRSRGKRSNPVFFRRGVRYLRPCLLFHNVGVTSRSLSRTNPTRLRKVRVNKKTNCAEEGVDQGWGGGAERERGGGESSTWGRTYSDAVPEAGPGLGASSTYVVAHGGFLAAGAVQVCHRPWTVGTGEASGARRVGACRGSRGPKIGLSSVAIQDWRAEIKTWVWDPRMQRNLTQPKTPQPVQIKKWNRFSPKNLTKVYVSIWYRGASVTYSMTTVN